jgi:hypothetical protein
MAKIDLNEVWERSMREFDLTYQANYDERMLSLEDRAFCTIAGAQWQGEFAEQFANRPKIEVNKTAPAVDRVENEYRNNRITVDFVSKDGASNDKMADVLDGLYRADEQASSANEAYDNAFQEGIQGGFGGWRLKNEYEDKDDPEDERQTVCIEPIFEADSCLWFDVNAKRQDKADAKRAWLLTSKTPDAYKQEFDRSVSEFINPITLTNFNWYQSNLVYIAEYYEIEEYKRKVHIFKDIEGKEERYFDDDFEADSQLLEKLTAIGTVKVRERKIEEKRVHKYIIDGSGVLEDCGYIAGKYIPLIPFFGKRSYVEGREIARGIVRPLKDISRLKNVQLSQLAFTAALSGIQKPIFDPEQVAGLEMDWVNDAVQNLPYLRARAMRDANGNPIQNGAIGYTQPPQIPPAMAAILQLTDNDMKELLGNQQQGEEMLSNMSGKAVELIQNRLDMQTFIYMSNFAKAMKRSGEVWLSMKKDITVEAGRKMKTIGRDGQVSTVEIAKPMLSEAGVPYLDNDLSNAKYEVAVDVGASSASKKAAVVRAITGILQFVSDPQDASVLVATGLMNMEGEGLGDLRNYFRQKLIRMGATEPTPEEVAQMQKEQENAQPNAQDQYLQAAGEEAQAKAAKARADTVATIAKAEETQANTVKIMTEIDASKQQLAIDLINEFEKPVINAPETVIVDTPNLGE